MRQIIFSVPQYFGQIPGESANGGKVIGLETLTKPGFLKTKTNTFGKDPAVLEFS